MGIKPSIHVETPPFQQHDWIYITSETKYPEEYGFYKVLQNIKTNEKIDEYQMVWANEEEYNYYMKFFNWRHTQSNVVNTRYIVNNSQSQICSQSYTAKIFIEHMKIRLSEISDIPYPENLYVLMESLEGFKQIFKHSNFFQIEENQICVDEHGNVKVWVNEDLSVNYLSNNGERDYRQKGQEAMVQRLIHIISENTDLQTQPSPSFLQYYEQKKWNKSMDFQEAKVLVLNYARINQTQIPIRFDAVISMDKMHDDHQGMSITSRHNDKPTVRQILEQDYNQRQDFYSQNKINPSYQYIDHSNKNTVNHFSQHQNNLYSSPHYTQPTSSNHIQPTYFNVNQQANPYPQQVQYVQQYVYPNQQEYRYAPPQQFIAYAQNPLPLVNRQSLQQNREQPAYHIPHYIKIQQPLRQISSNVIHYQPPQHQKHNESSLANPPLISRHSNQIFQQQLQLQNPKSPISKVKESQNDRKESAAYQLNDEYIKQMKSKSSSNYNQIHHNEEYAEQEEEYEEDYGELDQLNGLQPNHGDNHYKHERNNSYRDDPMNQISENDNLVARSLPISGDYVHNGQHLSTMGQDRAIYSHIQQDQWNLPNANGFGLVTKKQSSLVSNSQLKLKDSSLSQQPRSSLINKRPEIKQIKYYYSLQEEMQIDPDIAADLARYLS